MRTLYGIICEDKKDKIDRTAYSEYNRETNKWKLTSKGYEVIAAISLNLKAMVVNNYTKEHLKLAIERTMNGKKHKNDFINLLLSDDDKYIDIIGFNKKDIIKEIVAKTDGVDIEHLKPLKDVGISFKIVGNNGKSDIEVIKKGKVIERISMKLEGKAQWDSSNINKHIKIFKEIKNKNIKLSEETEQYLNDILAYDKLKKDLEDDDKKLKKLSEKFANLINDICESNTMINELYNRKVITGSFDKDDENKANYILILNPTDNKSSVFDSEEFVREKVKVRGSKRGNKIGSQRIRYDIYTDIEDPSDEDADVDPNDDIYKGFDKNDKHDPRTLYHRKTYKDGSGRVTKNFYNKNGIGIPKSELIKRIKKYINSKK